MKTKYVISLMLLVWLFLMANIMLQKTGNEGYMGNEENINELKLAQYTNQLLLVEVLRDKSMLYFYQKDDAGKWTMRFNTEALIGEEGLGKKVEGDRKTPAGVYCFTKAFGVLETPETSWDYVQIDENLYWVDDANSKYYNQLVSKKEVDQDWKSAEHLCEYQDAYAYVLALNYNEEAIPGKGSAVFLHCTSENMRYTAGCIAISQKAMEELLKLVEEQCIVIIDTQKNILEY